MNRLDFVLPNFMYYCWTSYGAKETWERPILRIIAALKGIEIESITHGLRACCLLYADSTGLREITEESVKQHLGMLPLETLNIPVNRHISLKKQFDLNKEYESLVVVGKKDKLQEFRNEWTQGNLKKICSMIGYPTCCRDFFCTMCLEQNYLDTTWNMALNSNKSSNDDIIEACSVPETNVLLDSIGTRIVPHFPCSFECTATISLGAKLLQLGIQLGYHEEMKNLKNILGLPLEWTSLHGIAEIKNSLFKISTRTDATATKYTIKLLGDNDSNANNNSS